MKKAWILVFAFLLLGTQAPAQKPHIRVIKNTVLRKIARSSVHRKSIRSNQLAREKLSHLSKKTSSPHQVQIGFPKGFERTVFQVQHSAFSHSTASAFALEVDGEVWGVTAGHVMDNIHSAPYIRATNFYGEDVFAPIPTWKIGNHSDMAVFKIPKEILPFVQVLKASRELPQEMTPTQSPCFVKGTPLFLPSEEVLFSGPHRILLQDNVHRDMTGFCGSPVLEKGEVVAVHMGMYSLERMQMANWNHLLTENGVEVTNGVHLASPIRNAIQLIKEWKQSSKNPTPEIGTPLKVFGRQVATMHSREHLDGIVLIRGGFLKKIIYSHPFMDFEKLEQFFDLEENDILRLTVVRPFENSQRFQTTRYEVNVSTGEVTTSSEGPAL